MAAETKKESRLRRANMSTRLLNQLISRAASVYPDKFILEYWDMKAKCPKENPNGGDTLAQFIALELADTFDPEADDKEQVETAVRVMQSAANDIAAVMEALRLMQQEE